MIYYVDASETEQREGKRPFLDEARHSYAVKTFFFFFLLQM